MEPFLQLRTCLAVVGCFGMASCCSLNAGTGARGAKGAPGKSASMGATGSGAGTAEVKSVIRSHAARGSFSLEQCLALAQANNAAQPIARSALAVAEAQHRQALAAYWPQIHATAGTSLRHDDMNYLQPAMHVPVSGLAVQVPDMQFTTPQTMVTLPANAFGPGFPPRAVQVPVASQSLTIPGRTIAVKDMDINVPEREITMMDRSVSMAGVDLKWLLWDGGARKAQRGLAQSGIDAAEADLQRTGLEVTRDVTRYFYGAVLAHRLLDVANNALGRMTTTLELTEQLYQNGGGHVLRTDYLRNKIMVDSLAGMIRELEGNRDLAEAALAFTMGLDWRDKATPSSRELPVLAAGDLATLVDDAYQFNPDWKKLEAGLDAAAHSLTVAKAGRLPRLALTGSLQAMTTGADGTGYATESNRRGWNVGIGFELPVWDGFLTKNRIAEAKARLAGLAGRKVQLGQGLALQVKSGFIRLRASSLQHLSSRDAVKAATENRSLSEQGYTADMVTSDKVFESQLLEALTEARALKCAYDHLSARAELDFTVGRSALSTLSPLP